MSTTTIWSLLVTSGSIQLRQITLGLFLIDSLRIQYGLPLEPLAAQGPPAGYSGRAGRLTRRERHVQNRLWLDRFGRGYARAGHGLPAGLPVPAEQPDVGRTRRPPAGKYTSDLPVACGFEAFSDGLLVIPAEGAADRGRGRASHVLPGLRAAECRGDPAAG